MKKLWAVVMVGAAAVLGAQEGSKGMVEWPYWAGDQGMTRYSAIPDITPANVNRLEIAWQWTTGEMPKNGMRPASFEATPLMIDNVLYLSTPFHRVVALNAETGAEFWSFDPEAYNGGEDSIGLKHRGVAFWRGGNETRIFMNTDQRLFSVDAVTGKLVTSFGVNGYASLTDGLRRPVKKQHFSQTSPPVVYKDLVIVGSRIPDRLMYKGDPPGTVQAFDARTGKRRWIFYTVPEPGEFGNETWEADSWAITGHSNVWGPMSLDVARGLLYVPVSTPSGDYWGGRRLGANLFADSIVCLDASTGQRKWHFQAVHHNVWDYDFTAAPNLVTITVDGKKIDAVAEVSKQGFTYVFDRVTGIPVWPIEERPVDTNTDVPGERLHATQPFPTKPPPYAKQGVSLDDANDLTPEIKELALEEMKKFRMGPLFTPPSLRGTIQRPQIQGAANWSGGGFDPETGLLYLRASEGVTISQVCKNDGSEPDIDLEYSNNCEYGAFDPRASRGEDAAPRRSRSKLGPIPFIKPPYARLVAINLNKGETAWTVPFGEGSPVIRAHPLLKGVQLPERLGTPGSNGVMVTKTGLVFIGGGDPYLYAFNKVTGREVSRVATPFRTSGNPMTYKARSGRQFVLIATGAGPDATLVAFALPEGHTSVP